MLRLFSEPLRLKKYILLRIFFVHCLRQQCFMCPLSDRPVHSDTILASLRSIQPYATINARRLLVHIFTMVYSQVFIYTAERTGAT